MKIINSVQFILPFAFSLLFVTPMANAYHEGLQSCASLSQIVSSTNTSSLQSEIRIFSVNNPNDRAAIERFRLDQFNLFCQQAVDQEFFPTTRFQECIDRLSQNVELTVTSIRTQEEEINPPFAAYSRSEAESFTAAYSIRIQNNNFQNTIAIAGENIDISHAPDGAETSFEITGNGLRAWTENAMNLLFTEDREPTPAVLSLEQVIAYGLSEVFDSAAFNGSFNGQVRSIQEGGRNPLFRPRSVPSVQLSEINRIREKIERRINILNSGSPTGFYVNENHIQGGMSIGGDRNELDSDPYFWLRINDNPRDRTVFLSMLDSIRTQNESNFLESMMDLATSFTRDLVAPKNVFIQAFSFLYVTKQFPSIGVLMQYCHFSLRCGQIH